MIRAAVLGQLVFAVAFLVEDVTRPGFRPWRQWVSHLSLGPWGWVNTAALVVGGLSALLAAIGLARLGAARPGRWLIRAVGAYGCALLLGAVCPIDPGLGWPPGQSPQHTLTGQLHQLAGAVAFAALTIAVWAGRRLPGGPRWVRWSTIAGVTVPASFLLCGVLAALDYSGVWSPAPSGLFERIALLTGIAWLVTGLIRLTSHSSHPGPDIRHHG